MRAEEINGINGSANTGQEPWLHLCALGTIHYLDVNRTRRLTSFFRIYNPARLRFMRAPDDDEYAEWEYEAWHRWFRRIIVLSCPGAIRGIPGG